jgi:hypothetical protein
MLPDHRRLAILTSIYVELELLMDGGLFALSRTLCRDFNMSLLDKLPFVNDPFSKVLFAGLTLLLFVSIIFLFSFVEAPKFLSLPEIVLSYAKFFYACFLKPHSGDGTGNQQDALESFYKAQAAAYDATRSRLLHGREDMLGLVAAQLKMKLDELKPEPKPVWIDVSEMRT